MRLIREWLLWLLDATYRAHLKHEYRRGYCEGRYYALRIFDESLNAVGVSVEQQDKILEALKVADERDSRAKNYAIE